MIINATINLSNRFQLSVVPVHNASVIQITCQMSVQAKRTTVTTARAMAFIHTRSSISCTPFHVTVDVDTEFTMTTEASYGHGVNIEPIVSRSKLSATPVQILVNILPNSSLYCKPFFGFSINLDKLTTQKVELKGVAAYSITESIYGEYSLITGATNGGSAYFRNSVPQLFNADGEPNDTSKGTLGRGTIEFWYYQTALPHTTTLLFDVDNFSTEIAIFERNDGRIFLSANFGGVPVQTPHFPLKFNQWNHIAVTLNYGVSASLYINGENLQTIRNNNELLVVSFNDDSFWRLGHGANQGRFNDFHVSKTVRYTGPGYTMPQAGFQDSDTYLFASLNGVEIVPSLFPHSTNIQINLGEDAFRLTDNNKQSSPASSLFNFTTPDELVITRFAVIDDVPHTINYEGLWIEVSNELHLTPNLLGKHIRILDGSSNLIDRIYPADIIKFSDTQYELRLTNELSKDTLFPDYYFNTSGDLWYDINNFTIANIPYNFDYTYKVKRHEADIDAVFTSYNNCQRLYNLNESHMDSESTIDTDNYRIRFATDSETLASEFTSFNRGTKLMFLIDNVFNPDLDIMNLGLYHLALNQRARNRYFNSAIDAEFGSTTDAIVRRRIIETYSAEFVSDFTVNATFDQESDMLTTFIINTNEREAQVRADSHITTVSSAVTNGREAQVRASSSMTTTWRTHGGIGARKIAGGHATLPVVSSMSCTAHEGFEIRIHGHFDWQDVDVYTTNMGTFTINWGDGVKELIPSGTTIATHTYPPNSFDGHTIKLFPSDNSRACGVNGISWQNGLHRVDSWGDFNLTSIQGLFVGSLSSTIFPSYLPSTVNNIRNCFKNSLISSDVTGWDVSNVTDMNSTFDGCHSFNQDISGWNTGNVTDMSYMFNDCDVFNRNLRYWNTANVTNMTRMFRNCAGFNPERLDWDVSNVTDMSFMFYGCTDFQSHLVNWNAVNVWDMSYMFYGCSARNRSFQSFNTSNVTDMNHMFAYSGQSLELTGSFVVDNVTDMSYMFWNATVGDAPSAGWNTTNVTNMEGMFQGANTYNGVQPASWNVSNVTNMSFMFQSNSSRTNFGATFSWNTGNVTNMSRMFSGCTSYNADMYWNTINVTDMSFMFSNCKSLRKSKLGTWNVSNVTNMGGMFSDSEFGRPLVAGEYGADDLIDTWNVSNVTNMSSMFVANNWFNQNISSWNTINLTHMGQMFQYASRFNQNLSGWNVSNVTQYLNYDEFAVEWLPENKPIFT